MNRGEIFSILEIDETKDKGLIRGAYMKKLSVTNPEDDAEGFKRLREAYEEAMRLADENEDTSPVGLWIKSVEEIYNNFEQRLDNWAWEEVFEDEVCTEVSTYETARVAMLRFIMENTYLPQFVFDMVITTFKIKEDYDELCESFPRGFIDFILRGGNGIRIELVQAKNGQDADEVCNLWFAYRSAKGEDDKEKQSEIAEKYSQIPARMPYFDADLAVELAIKGEKEKALAMLDDLSDSIGVDGYISAACANAYVNAGEAERAAEICDIVEEKFPGNVVVKIVRADIIAQKGDLKSAKKLYEDIYGETNNPEVFEKLQKLNENLIEDYLKSDSVSDKLELGWCYYQNEQNEELMELMDSFKPAENEENELAMYYNLRSRALLNAERLEEADECIEKWREALNNQVTDNEKDENDRKRRIVLSAFFAARCLRIMADRNNDDSYRERALAKSEETTVCEEKQVLLQLWLERVAILKELGRYDESIRLCNDILENDESCFPACIIRQECNFELKNAGAVLDDYHKVMDIVPNLDYGLPYALAAHVFVLYDRYDNALDIISHAEENGAVSDYLDYVKASAMRYRAKSAEDTKEALDMLLAIAEKDESERVDFTRKRSLDLFEEICFAYMDMEDWDKANEAIDKAIALEPDNIERYRIKLDIYKKSDNTAAVNECLTDVKRKFGRNPFAFYEEARLLEDKNRRKAIILYKQALKLDSTYKDANSRLRELYQREYLENFDEDSFNKALAYANNMLEQAPYSRYYLERGILYMSGGFADKAEADFKKSVDLDDEYILALEWLGDALRIQEKHNSALKYYEEAYKLARGNGNYYPAKDYALGCEAAMDYDKATELLLEMTKDFPEEKFVWSALGDLYKKTGEYEKSFEAFMHYRTAYEISPNQLVNNDMDLLELALLMDNKKNRVFTLLGDTIAKYPDMPEAYINMAEYYCYFVGDKKLMYKFANKAVDMAKSQGDQYVIKKCYRLRTEYAYILGDYKKIKLMKMMYSPSFDPAKAYRDKRYKKMELYRYALQAYFEGDKKSSFKYFKDMQEGSNCINCRYNVCVEALLGKALMLEDEGKYDEALKCLERISEESFDPHLINEFAKKIKEKM